MRKNETSRWLHWFIVPIACLVLLPVGSMSAKAAVAPLAVTNAASYDTAVASWMGTAYADTTDGTGFPAWTGATLHFWMHMSMVLHSDG